MALAVYSGPDGDLVVARESGFEGVACIDDTARVLDVLCGVWERTRDPEIERWARGLLEFVLSMQDDDGRWWNFIYDWSGTRNETGLTSSTGENFWHARALCGVSRAWLTFGDERALAAARRGLDHAIARPAPSDVRALHVIVGVRLLGDRCVPRCDGRRPHLGRRDRVQPHRRGAHEQSGRARRAASVGPCAGRCARRSRHERSATTA